MNTLLDAIKANKPAPQPAPISGQQVSSILQTAATGKVGAVGGAPAASNIQEQQAQQTAQVQQRTLKQEGQQQQAQLGIAGENQATAIDLSTKAQDEQVEDARSRLLLQTNQALGEYQQGVRTLDLQKDKARLEQIGFGMRLSNDKYLSDLHREGQKSRLNNETAFKEEMTRAIFADEEDLFKDDLRFRALMKADSRDFQRQLADLDINQALKIASAESSAANAQMQWTAAGNLAGAGIQAYTQNQKEKA